MNIESGCIKPTTTDEAIVFRYYLRRHEEDCYRDPLLVSVKQDQSISEADSYGLYCGLEKAVNGAYPQPKIAAESIIIDGLKLMSEHTDRVLPASFDSFCKK